MLPPGNFFRKRPALEMSMISSFLVLRFCTESRNYYISTVKSVKDSFIIFRSLFQSHAPLKPFEDRLETRAPVRLLAALLQRQRRFPVPFPFFPLQQVRLNTTLLGDRPCFPLPLGMKSEVPRPAPRAARSGRCPFPFGFCLHSSPATSRPVLPPCPLLLAKGPLFTFFPPIWSPPPLSLNQKTSPVYSKEALNASL